MTEPTTELEVRREAPVAAPVDTDSWTQLAKPVFWLAEQIAHTEFVPKGLRGNPAATAAAMLHGREMGLGPMTSLTETHVIEGRPSTSAKALRGKVLAAGHEIRVPETTGGRCVMQGRRRGESNWTEITWTMDMARAAGLANKNNWKNFPRRMLQARATSELCDLIFPDVTLGLAVAEVVEDDGELDGESQSAPAAAIEGPKTTVSRAKRAPRAQQAPVPSGETGPAPATPPPPMEVDVPMPDSPAPSGPVTDAAPGPEVGSNVPADLVEAAGQAPERAQPGEVVVMVAPRITANQIRMLHTVLGNIGVDDSEKHDTIETLLGHELVGGTTKSLTKTEAKGLLDTLVKLQEADEPREALDALLAERMRGGQS